jgi:hypothetical protein
LNQFVVDSVYDALSTPTAPPLSDGERLRAALGDLVMSRPWTLIEPDDDQTPLLSHEELQRILPPLDPPLSESIISDREDRC